MHLLSKIGLAAVAVVICGLFIQAIQSPEVASQTTQTATKVEQQSSQILRVEALDIPNVMTFAGERVPLQDTDVRERLDREIHVNTYWHSNMLLMIKKSNRFF